jgi:predicted RecB family nuclease
MFRLGGQLVFGPTDLTKAVECEFALLRNLDVLLGRVARPEQATDPMLERTARLGIAHESRVLAEFQERFGSYDRLTGRGVYTVARPNGADPCAPEAAAKQTLAILRSGADVVYQAAFLRGRFNGYADFVVREDGTDRYAVYDTKLARHAKVTALLQLAAYAEELVAQDIPLGREVYLLLGDGTTFSQDLADLLPVYRERRARLETIVDMHVEDEEQAAWDDARFVACGRCDTCAKEVAAHRDLLLVAGMRISQRSRLREAGVGTIDALASRTTPVNELRQKTFESLRAQANLQIRQNPPCGADSGNVAVDVFNPDAFAALPAADQGDVFFDFEGDPLWSDGDPSVSGLEYLFGVLEVDGSQPAYRSFWAHDRSQEKQALQAFLSYVMDRRDQYPSMHIYHYAAYEKSALLRLAGRYGVGEGIVDGLLSDGVLVDLFTLVRNSLRVSQPSYSLKMLEPIYMGEQIRQSDVKDAGDSIVAYADYCDLRDGGEDDSAAFQLAQIADYNEYDCRSTYKLRDWLLGLACEHGVDPIGAHAPVEEPQEADNADLLVTRLLGYVGDGPREARTPGQQAIALLAASIGYHRREAKPFWWAHFDRLINPVSDWADTGEVLVVDEAEVVEPWARQGTERNFRRRVRLAGRLGIGSLLDDGSKVCALYDAAAVPAGVEHNPAHRGVTWSVVVESRSIDARGRDEIVVVESRPNTVDAYDELPIAIAPGRPIPSQNLHAAIVTLAETVAARLDAGHPVADVLAGEPSLELLTRIVPTFVAGAVLPVVRNGDYTTALAAAVRSLDRSCLAVQGPPGSGKTYHGARVIAHLVATGWRVGVVAQSHKVIENMLAEISRAGVGADHIGKRGGTPSGALWTELGKDSAPAAFLADHTSSGCVLGGTAWDFTNRRRVAADNLDLLVIDEAGQFSLANTIAVSVAARRLMLLGDPQQLPQVSQGTHPEPCETSALAWIIEGRRVLSPQRGYFLERTWRMHPALAAAVSRFAYDDQLIAQADVTAARSLDGVDPGVLVVEVDHAGNSVESPQEADTVVKTVGELLGRTWSTQPALRTPIQIRDFDLPPQTTFRDGVFLTTLLTGETVGWDMCGACFHHWKSCRCLAGVSLPRWEVAFSAESASPSGARPRKLIVRVSSEVIQDGPEGPRPLEESDILVVAPYNAQVAMIRRRLDVAGHSGVRAGTVDKFQGQQAPVVIVSMTASAPEDVPRGMDFLLSRNRVNVAISRGQWCAVIIRSPRLTDYLPTNPEGLGRLGAFICLCTASDLGDARTTWR